MAVTKVDDLVTFTAEYERVRPWLLDALSYNDEGLTEERLLADLLSRKEQLWTSDHAACVSSIRDWNGKSVCLLLLIGGEKGKALIDIFQEGLPELQAWAATFQCDGLLGIGRPQWGRLLKRYGFEIDDKHFYKGLSR